MNKTTLLVTLIVALIIVGGGWYIFTLRQSQSAPNPNLKATAVKELGRDHILDISGVTYSSNPPTSGSHFAIWAKRGAYPYVISDGHLIHSLEHGYVVASYNCEPDASSSGTLVYQKGAPLTTLPEPKSGDQAFFTPSTNTPKAAGKLPDSFQTSECQSLVKELTGFLSTADRFIVVPRVNMGAKIALTAWGHIDTMDALDKNRIQAFIDTYQYKGPEQTME